MSHLSERELQPGQVIADRYRLEAPIGRGAMGSVWRAVHVRLESPVAIKFLNASIAGDPDMLERFMREARSAAAVRSSHVVQIFDYGVDAGVPYIAMELLVGETLDERLAARGALAPPELDRVFAEVARAVGVAHELGVVHRDIKPANIFIAREAGHEVTKVLDFGIAKLIDRRLEQPVASGTHTGIILGTPNYMSPEQARGHRNVDHRADLWSLAVLAFECLTGQQPFESSSVGDLVVEICTAEPRVPSDLAPVPAAFDAWFRRGTQKDPEARFASASEMSEALHALLAAEGLGAESRPRSSRARAELAPAEFAQEDGLELVSSDASPVASPSVRDGLRPSVTAHDVGAGRITSSSAPARRRIAALAIPLVVLGAALVASAARWSQAEPSSAVAAARTSGAPVAPPPEVVMASGAPVAPVDDVVMASSAPIAPARGALMAPSAPIAAAPGALMAPSAPTTVATREAEAAAARLAANAPVMPAAKSTSARNTRAVPARRAKRSGALEPSRQAAAARSAPAAAPAPSIDPFADRL